MKNHSCQKEFLCILEDELILASGCTEPASVAFAAAILTNVLGEKPVTISASISSHILKNIKSVAIPNTNGLSGIESAIAAGIISGQYKLGLNILSQLNPEFHLQIKEFANTADISIHSTKSNTVFEIDLIGSSLLHTARVKIVDHHSNIVLVLLDNKDITASYKDETYQPNKLPLHYELLNVSNIVEFAKTIPLDEIKHLIYRQINYNIAIAEEGLKNKYGASIGKLLLGNNTASLSLKEKAKAYASAGSDARMNGANNEVCIISGSGNQGIASVLPVVIYADGLLSSEEQLYRAVIIADLITVYQKQYIGCLSAYCGATSAGCGAACGICFLLGGTTKEIEDTLSNSISIASGMICDGAKSSCAAKIAIAVEAGIIGCQMAMAGKAFKSGEGIIADSVDQTVKNVGVLACSGMKSTNDTIVQIMLKEVNYI